MAEVVVHVSVRGRVQGVGFRAFVERQAFERQLKGWVRNCRDGSVEALIAGDAGAVADMIDVCRKGPLGSRVDALYDAPGSSADLRERVPGQAFSVLPTI